MSPVFYIFFGFVIAWFFLGRRSCRRRTQVAGPDLRDSEIDRLTERVRTLERIITDSDWRLRRDFDGL